MINAKTGAMPPKACSSLNIESTALIPQDHRSKDEIVLDPSGSYS
jgi:hypothetical protein